MHLSRQTGNICSIQHGCIPTCLKGSTDASIERSYTICATSPTTKQSTNRLKSIVAYPSGVARGLVFHTRPASPMMMPPYHLGRYKRTGARCAQQAHLAAVQTKGSTTRLLAAGRFATWPACLSARVKQTSQGYIAKTGAPSVFLPLGLHVSLLLKSGRIRARLNR